MAIILFIAKLLLSTGLLYGYYQLFLRNQRFHHYNRFYLLGIALISVIIPFINIPVNLFWGSQQHPVLIQTLKVINANGWEEPVTIYARRNAWLGWLNLQTGFWLLYAAGLLTGIFLLVQSFWYITRLRKKYPHEMIEQLKLYQTREPGTPFSFFKSIFWDHKVALDSSQGQQIFRHELFHVKEKHSADILLMEILCCIAWINPFFHLIKKEIKAIHEFLADEYAASASNRYEYAELLVLHAIKQKTPPLTHPFFHNQIKRRITMITQSNLIRRSGYLRRIMALPLLFVLISAFAVKLVHGPSNILPPQYAAKNMTVVIDAGHGGIYPGTISEGKIAEKDITLSIAQKIKALAPGFNIDIVLTRNNDALVGNAKDLREDLLNRVAIAKNAHAAAFISIHINATASPNTDSTGIEAWISGKKDDAKARQLASTLLTSLKSTYATDETIQQREMGVQVLDHNSCPAVLLECGFITNPTDLAFMSNSANQEKIARKILEGIVQYSNAQTAAGTTYDQTDTVNPNDANVYEKIQRSLMKNIYYPEKALLHHKQAEVLVSFVVNSRGAVENTTLLTGDDYGFGNQAYKTLLTTKAEDLAGLKKNRSGANIIKFTFLLGNNEVKMPFENCATAKNGLSLQTIIPDFEIVVVGSVDSKNDKLTVQSKDEYFLSSLQITDSVEVTTQSSDIIDYLKKNRSKYAIMSFATPYKNASADETNIKLFLTDHKLYKMTGEILKLIGEQKKG